MRWREAMTCAVGGGHFINARLRSFEIVADVLGGLARAGAAVWRTAPALATTSSRDNSGGADAPC
jgi:hypothetical protein